MRRDLPVWLLGALPVPTLWGALAALRAADATSFRTLLEEDGPVEWATVCACAAAAIAFGASALGSYRAHRKLAWLSLALVAFCVFFAGEELSWGQRLFAFRPPAYFLEHNTQQELNLHNLFKDVLRTKYLLMVLLAGYGVLLPVGAHLLPAVRRLLAGLGGHAPPLSVVPGSVATLAMSVAYPWPYTGEAAECAFALLLYLAAVLPGGDHAAPVRSSIAAAGLVVVLAWGAAIPVTVRALTASDETRVRVAARETEQLAEDWLDALARSRIAPSGCGTHLRVFRWVRDHRLATVRAGRFARSPASDRALDDEVRRRYFIDPWNEPYWIWHQCEDGRQRVLFYSFGPDRARSSTSHGRAGDDVATQVTR